MKANMLTLVVVLTAALRFSTALGEEAPLSYTVELDTARHGFDGKTCWVHARAGSIPPLQPGNQHASPLVVMTMQKLQLEGSDVFQTLNELHTSDLGKSWSPPVDQTVFVRRSWQSDVPFQPALPASFTALLKPGDEITVCDFTPKWHAATQTLLGVGQTVSYRNNRIFEIRPRATAYAVFDAEQGAWKDWKVLGMPDREEFGNVGSGSTQRYDLDNGEVLVPIFFRKPGTMRNSVAVCRCTFDGDTLTYLEHGNEITVNDSRGLQEPSLTKFRDKFYLTSRNNNHGYVSTSTDGLNYTEARRWTFDDGSDLGNYNTQQHWVTHSEGLFLVYTRKGANNDHVFRHRAPLFIARVDPEQLHVLRETERILVPERGARLGNFGVTDVSPTETWVTVAEWMQPRGVPEKHGSNNSVFVAKIKWDRPNGISAFRAPR